MTSVPTASVLPAMAVAVASAGGFAISTSLQHRAAGRAPASVAGTVQLLRYLFAKPQWLAASGAGLVSFSLHAFALRLGAIALVQPLMAAGVVLAVPVRAALDRSRPSRLEVLAVAVAAAGLAVFLVAGTPHGGGGRPHPHTVAGFLLAAATVATCAAGGAARLQRPRLQAILFAVAAGTLFGATAMLMKLVATDLDPAHLLATVADWPIWALAVAGGCGSALNQRAYRVAPLSISMPVVNIVAAIVAATAGGVVFGEVIAHDPVARALQCVALAGMAAGLWLLGRGRRQAPAPCDAAGRLAPTTAVRGDEL